jgi:SAM-dependent methyltransferase
LDDASHYWDQVAERWDDGQQRLWGRHADAMHLRVIGPWLPGGRGGRLLKTDLFEEAWRDGLLPSLRGSGDTVVGIDLSLGTARRARSRHASLQAIGADVRRLPFRGESFDVVVSNSTLDHFQSIDELQASVRELRRVLRPGGELLMTLDNGANPAVALRNALPYPLLRRLGIVPYYVGVTYTPAALRCQFADVGFEIRELQSVMHCPRMPAVWAARLLERFGRSSTRARFLAALMAFERLSSWPTRFLTGYFIAVRAVKRS